MDSSDAQGAVTRQGGDDQAQKATKSTPVQGTNETKRNETQGIQAPGGATKETYYLSAAGAFALAMFGLNCQIGAAITFDPSAEVPDLSLFVSGGPVVYGFFLSAGISGGFLEGGPSEMVSPSLSVLGGYKALGVGVPVGSYDTRTLRPSFSAPTGAGVSYKAGPTVGIGLFSSQGYAAKWTAPPPSSAFWKR